jgi:DDE superfamily endonuclease
MGDRDAISQVKLGAMVNNLPGLYCVIGDCAYTASEHMVPIDKNADKMPRQDNFNFYASQLRIRIEMAFGLMIKKWAILSRPLSIKLSNVKRLMVAIARRLHNFCINEHLEEQQESRIAGTDIIPVFTPTKVGFNAQETMLRELAADFEAI